MIETRSNIGRATKAQKRSGSTEAKENSEVVGIPFIRDFLDICPPELRGEMLRLRRESVAYHEAGHLVAAYRLGFRLKEKACELFDRGPSTGFTFIVGEDTKFDGSHSSRNRIEDAAIVLLSGAAAVKKLRKSYESGLHLSASDYDRAKELVEVLTPPVSDPDLSWHTESWSYCGSKEVERVFYFNMLEYRSERFISTPENWTSIKKLAAALLKSGKISASEVQRLVA